jgi:hypothetical protein
LRGFEHYKYLGSRGINALPVIHQGESTSWLDVYRDQTDYVGLSPSVNFGPAAQRQWLDHAFARLDNVRTHAFGVTSPSLIARYPWTSFDSATWALQAANGRVVVPSAAAGGGYDFSRSIYVTVTGAERDRIRRPSNLIEDMGRQQRDHIRRYIATEGLTIEDVRNRPSARRQVNLAFYQDMAAAFGGTFVAACNPSDRLTKLLPLRRHQPYRLLSWAHLAD